MRPTESVRSERADVLVIGGGVTGAFTTFELVKRGYSVTVLEKANLGNGSSSRSAACIRAQWDDRENVIAMMYTEAFYSRFYDVLEVPVDDRRETIFTKNGYLFLYEDPASAEPGSQASLSNSWEKARAAARMQQQLGLPVEILKPEEVNARWQHLNPSRIIGATWCPEDGFLNHDLLYLLAFKRAQALGAQVVTGAEVTGEKHANGRIVSLQTSKGEFHAGWIVNATSQWAPRVSRLLGGSDLPIAPLKRYLYHVSPDPRQFTTDAWKTYPMTIYGMGPGRGAYTRPHHSELMYGWSHTADPEPDFTDEDQDTVGSRFHHDSADPGAHWLNLRLSIQGFSQQIAHAGKPRTTCGYYDETPDRYPILDVDPKVQNLVHAAGFSGHGLMMAPATSLVIAGLIDGGGLIAENKVLLPPGFLEKNLAFSSEAFSLQRDFNAKKEGAYI